MSSQRVTTVLTYGVLSLAGIVSFSLPKALLRSSAAFVQAPSDVMMLSGVIRDFSSSHPDFDINNSAAMRHSVGNVSLSLGIDRRPSFTGSGLQVTSEWYDINGNRIVPYAGPGLPCGETILDTPGTYGVATTGGISDAMTFDQWFVDTLGTNQSTGHTISLQRDDDGVYEYRTNDFFPIDNRLMGNQGDANNNYFTYTIAASFTYDMCIGQFFEFASNDDAWVFINNEVVIDLGGVDAPEMQYVNLDRLGLNDGEDYTLYFFFAHRRDTYDSLFHMRTNIPLITGVLPSMTAFYD